MKSFCLAVCMVVSVGLVKGQAEDFNAMYWTKADSIASRYPNHSLYNLALLSHKLTSPLLTDEEKFRSIYKWVCENISYDNVLFMKNQRQREKLSDPNLLQAWYKKVNVMMFDGLLKKHKTICTGYAYLVQELARHAGISCEIVDGYGRSSISNVGGVGTPSHQWNAVKLSGKWYLCDATWSCGYMLGSLYVKNFNSDYFLMDPKLFIRNHYPLNPTWALLDEKPTLHEFLNRPLIYSNFFRLNSTKLYPETFEVSARKKVPITFKFNSKQDSLNRLSYTVGQWEMDLPQQVKDSSGYYSISHQFTSKGVYMVHVKQNKAYLFSYKVIVR